MAGVELLFLGTGTSYGIPVVGCNCSVCTSPLRENKRLRCSALVTYNGKNILIDTSPDLRTQMLNGSISQLDAILFTHHHADHLFGLDDIRIFNRIQHAKIPCFAPQKTVDMIYRNFDYIFKPPPLSDGGIPQIEIITVHKPFVLYDRTIVPIPVYHGKLPILGFRIGSLAYITDCSFIPETSMTLLEGVELLVLNGLRYTPHVAHYSIEEAVRVIEVLKPKTAYLTHISHDVDHDNIHFPLPDYIQLAYDGLAVRV